MVAVLKVLLSAFAHLRFPSPQLRSIYQSKTSGSLPPVYMHKVGT